MLHPQKREDLKGVLENVMGRVLELRAIVDRLFGNFSELDEVMIDMKFGSSDIEIRVPRFIREENEKEIKRREILLDVLKKRPTAKVSTEPSKNTNNLTLSQAVLIIQTNERGRQGRRVASIKLERKMAEEKKNQKEETEDTVLDEAALKIQKVFRGFYWRKRIEKEKRDESIFIGMSLEGMAPKSHFKTKKNTEDAEEKKPSQDYLDEIGRAKRKIKQAENKRDLEEQRIALRAKIIEEEGPKMMEDMHDALLEQILLYRQEGDGGIPKFPTEKEGGSKAFMQNVMNATELQKKQIEEKKKQLLEPQGKGDKKGAAKAKPKDEKKPAGKDTKKGSAAEEKGKGTFKDESKFIPSMAQVLKGFVDKWRDRNSSLDFDQKYELSFLRTELMKGATGIEEELRKNVDKKIRAELENIKTQIASEAPPKKDTKPKPTPKPVAETKIPSSEAFFSDLAAVDIIKKVPPTPISSYLGTHRLIGSILEWEEPSIAQIRNACQEIVLYMSSPTVHKSAPPLRSLLLYGHKGTGKTMLAQAIAHELGAVFFDLSPAVTQNISVEQSETNTMVGKVFRVAKDVQPAVIFIDDFDTVIKGKGKGKTKPNMKRLRKPLQTALKAMTPDDRFLIIGSVSEPWDADQKLLEDFFDKMICTSLPDYSSCSLIWKTLIEKKTSQPLCEDFDLHTLSHISTNYTPESINLIVDSVLTDRRLKKLDSKPITVEEFVTPLSKIDPIYKQDDLKMKQFTQKLPLKFRKKTKEDKDKDRAELEAKMAELQKKPSKKK